MGLVDLEVGSVRERFKEMDHLTPKLGYADCTGSGASKAVPAKKVGKREVKKVNKRKGSKKNRIERSWRDNLFRVRGKTKDIGD